MALRADDCNILIDTELSTGAVRRTLSLSMEIPLETSKWSEERAAASTSLAAWLYWMQMNTPENHTFVVGLSSVRQEGLRQALLKAA